MYSRVAPPRLHHIASLWTLWDYPSVKREWSLEQKIAAIKEAGFDGFAADLDKEHGRVTQQHGLYAIGYICSAEAKEFRRLITRSIEGGAVRINVQLGNHDTPLDEA